jgi:hypothetical protein
MMALKKRHKKTIINVYILVGENFLACFYYVYMMALKIGIKKYTNNI